MPPVPDPAAPRASLHRLLINLAVSSSELSLLIEAGSMVPQIEPIADPFGVADPSGLHFYPSMAEDVEDIANDPGLDVDIEFCRLFAFSNHGVRSSRSHQVLIARREVHPARFAGLAEEITS